MLIPWNIRYPYVNNEIQNLDWVLGELLKIEEEVSNIESNILAQANAYTDEQITQRLSGVEQLIIDTEAEFNRLINELQGNYSNFTLYVTTQLNSMRNRIDALTNYIDASIVLINARTDEAIRQNNEYLMDELSKGLINLKVLNYFTGEYVTIQAMFDYLAQFHLQNAITYAQLIASELTYNDLIAKDETYTDWAVNGYNIVNP